MAKSKISLDEGQKKKNLIFVYYNPCSHGSFLKRAEKKIYYFSRSYNIFLILGKKSENNSKEETFKKAARNWPVQIIERNLTENNSLVTYAKSYFWMISFILKNKIKLVYIMDYIYWKPAEILAAKNLKIPVIGFMAFYKEKEAFKGFLPSLDYIIVNSKKTAESFISFGLESKTKILHNFIDPKEYMVEPATWPTFKDKKHLVGFVGALLEIKGIEYFIEAAAEILKKQPETGFIIVGGEKEEGYLEKLEQKVKKLALKSHFLFAGHRDDIPNIMASFDVLVVPSLEEPFGYVNIEAGASGVPVVASRVGGIPEIIVDGETGFLFEAKDSRQIAEKVCLLLDDQELRESFGRAAKERVQKEFSVSKALKDWEKIFNEFVR